MHTRMQRPLIRPLPGLRALSRFFRLEAAGGLILMAAAGLALIASNSPLAAVYQGLQQIPMQVRIGELDIAKPLLLWINDGLMAVFFLLVALEIKRESLSGQLANREQLVLPMVCAVVGVAIPALLFTAFNHDNAVATRGWAVPTATDIAFALGILALLGSRVPSGMKVLLSTIAVVDDLIAILIIAVFDSHGLSIVALAWSCAAVLGMLLLNRLGVRRLAPYLLLGVALWVGVLKSGMHATLAGVVTGLLIPHTHGRDVGTQPAHSPLESLEHALHPWVAYAILPVFAFANAGLTLTGLSVDHLFSPVSAGIVAGLLIGKPFGIVAAAWVLRSMGWSRLPRGMDMRAMVGLGILCGVGFTMSLFIGSLAYTDPLLYRESVLGVLVASVAAALAGYGWLRVTLPARSSLAARGAKAPSAPQES